METLMSKQDVYAPIRKEHVSIAQIAHTIASEIKDYDTLKYAVDFLLKIKTKRNQWKEFIKPALEAAFLAHKRIKDIEKEIDLPLKRAEEEILKPAISKYDLEQSKVREEKQEELSKESGIEVTLANENRISGISFKTIYSAEIVDMKELCKAIAAGVVPPEAVKANPQFLNAAAKSLKTAMYWPGVRLISERAVSARTNLGVEEEL